MFHGVGYSVGDGLHRRGAADLTVAGSGQDAIRQERMSSGMVAERTASGAAPGRRRRMRRMSGKKPMSHMRSASSSTNTSTCVRSTSPSPAWSRSRPGQATRIARPRGRQLAGPCSRRRRRRRCRPVLAPRSPIARVRLLGELRVGARMSAARPVAAGQQVLEDGQDERGGLAGARLGEAEDVVAREHRGWPVPGWASAFGTPAARTPGLMRGRAENDQRQQSTPWLYGAKSHSQLAVGGCTQQRARDRLL